MADRQRGNMSIELGKVTLFTVEELAERLDVQERTIREYLREGRLRGRKLAGRWYVTDEAIADYFRQGESSAAEEEPLN
jgi:excisionase family DNA binding protein